MISWACEMGAHIENARGGVLHMSPTYSQHQGPPFDSNTDMTFSFASLVNSRGQYASAYRWLFGNRFPALKSVESMVGSGFWKIAPATTTRCFLRAFRVHGHSSHTLRGAYSVVELVPAPARAPPAPAPT